MRTFASLLFVGCCLLFATVGCRSEATPDPKVPAKPLMIYAAASTTEAVEEAAAAFTKVTKQEIKTNFAASSTLAQQIVAGAEADLFLSANEAWANHVTDAKLEFERRDLLGNELVVVIPNDSTLVIDKPEDLAGEAVKRLAVGDPESVPAGQYAKESLEKLSLWEPLKGRLVAADDVRKALMFVETGDADAGIVFATDAQASSKVRVVYRFAASTHSPIRYPLMRIKSENPHRQAQVFFDFLCRGTGEAIFRKHGFVWLGESGVAPAAATSPAPIDIPATAP